MSVELSKETLAGDAAILQEFVQTQGFAVWNKYLEYMGEDFTTLLVNGYSRPLDEVRYHQGVLAGLRMAQQVPDNVERLRKLKKT